MEAASGAAGGRDSADAASAESRVELPADAREPFEVYLNGVRQQPGSDFVLEGRTLVFTRALAREGRLGFWRWLSMFLGLVGTYRPHDSVDVQYRVDGREKLASDLEVVGAPTGTEGGKERSAGGRRHDEG